MNDEARTQLRVIVERFGRDVALDVRRCEGLMRDLCGKYPRELNVLIVALRAGVPQEIHRSALAVQPALAARLARRLEDDYAMAADATRWAVDTWLFALGGEMPMTSRPSASEPRRGSGPQPAEGSALSASRRSRVAERVERLLDEAAAHEHRGEWSAAVEVYDDVLAIDPGHAEAQSLRAATVRRRERELSAGPESVQPAFQRASPPAPPGIAPLPLPGTLAARAVPPPLPRTITTPAAPPGYVQISPGESAVPSRLVQITRAFWLKATPVTQGEYAALMGTNPSYFKREGPTCPVENVSWHDAVAYVNKLSDREGLPRAYDANGDFAGIGCRGYRLPTGDEWDYACRAGKSLSRPLALDQVAWHDKNSGRRTRPVALKQPNAWGLYDMLGNVEEWVQDGYGDYREFRGGSWLDCAAVARLEWKSGSSSGIRSSINGFRPARTLP